MKITGVFTNDEYLLTISFDNQHTATIDMRNKLHTARFSELNDINLFRSAKTDGRAILWANGISISTSEILEILGK